MALLESCDTQRHRLIKANGYPISGIRGLYDKSCFIREQLLKDCAGVKIDAIVVEESLMSFRRNMSSAGVIAILNRFNGIVSFVARDTFGVPVHFVASTTARKAVGIKIDKTFDTKLQIFNWVRARPEMEGHMWPTKQVKAGARKGKTVFVGTCFDVSDAFVVGLWACENLNISQLNETIC
jgi:hypothetical protein